MIFVFLLFLSFSGFSQNDLLFEEANAAYRDGNYQAAVKAYEQILENGELSAELYYNLGNAHYKLNNVAPSIYYFEKALQLDPTDEDIQNNIVFARNMAIDDIEAIEQTGFSQWLNSITGIFSYATWAIVAIVFSVLFVILFLLYYFAYIPLYKRLFFGTAILCVFLCILSVIFAYQQRSFIQDNQFAIIFEEEVEVRDEPNLRGDASFELHEGTKTRILEDYQEWSRIELANGAQGWIKSNTIKRL